MKVIYFGSNAYGILARVEYYFSDVLSIIESRNRIGKSIVTDKLLNRELLP
ncbi:hypothetical protein [Thermoanaerobacterium saccharolyticum]|uniref:hypothetical protein n=1 Tax=Thermoanaerobacterium saccharolyticum TaxID=28896 RepID=UPI002FD88B39